jgi:hypothetical protein
MDCRCAQRTPLCAREKVLCERDIDSDATNVYFRGCMYSELLCVLSSRRYILRSDSSIKGSLHSVRGCLALLIYVLQRRNPCKTLLAGWADQSLQHFYEKAQNELEHILTAWRRVCVCAMLSARV